MFNKSDMQIYRYYDGSKYVKADPARIQIDLLSANLDYDTDVKKVQLLRNVDTSTPIGKKALQEGLEAYKRILEAARTAFNVKAYQGDDEKEDGLTDPKVLELCLDFNTYCDELKNAQGPSPI